MKLTLTDDRYVISGHTKAEEKFIKDAGFRWDGTPEARYWYTTSAAVAAEFKAFADKPTVDRINATNASVAASHAHESPYQFPCPEGMDYRQYQKAGITFAYGRWGTLFGDDMGLGKTIQAIGTINADGDAAFPVLIVCPAHLRQNWYMEIAQWLVQRNRTVYVAWDTSLPTDYGTVCLPDVVIVNYEKLRGTWMDYITSIHWGTAIVDEIHYAKNLSSQRGRSIYGHKDKPGVFNVARRKMALSGTIIENKTMDIWPIAHAFAPEEFPSKEAFIARYCSGKLDQSATGRAAELQEKLRSTFMIRRLKKDVLKELPPKQRQLLCIQAEDQETMDLIAEEQRILGIDTAVDSDIEGMIEKMRHGNPIGFSQVSKIRAMLGMKKAPYVASHVCGILDERPEHQTIVFAHHKDVCDYLVQMLSPYGCAVINGDTPQRQRQAIADQFCAGQYGRALVCSLEAAATGFNLQAAWHMVFAEVAWKPSTNQQAEARVDRMGQQNRMLMQYLVFNGSLDSRIMELNLHKQRVSDAVLDRRD